MIFPNDPPWRRRSQRRCVACQTPLAIEGEWAFCTWGRCRSALSNEGASGSTEAEAVERLTELVEAEMENAVWEAVPPF